MLSRQDAEGLHVIKADSVHLPHRLCLGHLVKRLDRDARVFAAVLDQIDPSTGTQSLDQCAHHLERIGEFVVGVDQERGIQARRRQTRVVFLASDQGHVLDSVAFKASLQKRQHLGLDVDRIDLALWHCAYQPHAEVAAAGADIGDLGIPGKVHCRNDTI
jgi:hypothetical protein